MRTRTTARCPAGNTVSNSSAAASTGRPTTCPDVPNVNVHPSGSKGAASAAGSAGEPTADRSTRPDGTTSATTEPEAWT
jgi:hypothetical protein